MYTEIHYLYELYQYTFHCISILLSLIMCIIIGYNQLQGGSNMTGTDLCVNKPHCAAAVRP